MGWVLLWYMRCRCSWYSSLYEHRCTYGRARTLSRPRKKLLTTSPCCPSAQPGPTSTQVLCSRRIATGDQDAVLSRFHPTVRPPHQRAFYFKATTSAHRKNVAQGCTTQLPPVSRKIATSKIFARTNESAQPSSEPCPSPTAQAAKPSDCRRSSRLTAGEIATRPRLSPRVRLPAGPSETPSLDDRGGSRGSHGQR